MPGAELVLRVRDIVPSPNTTIVVNCAGRTRSIIGAQSLISTGVPNRVVALRNGTMGWHLAGLICDAGRAIRAPDVSSGGLVWAKSAAESVARKFGVERIDRATLERYRSDATRTLYVFDVRDPNEYVRSGQFPGAISAPGGQLVQATDIYAGTLGARIVLSDDKEVRAALTASWLKQMGWNDVLVLPEAGNETNEPDRIVLGTPALDCAVDPLCCDCHRRRQRDRSVAQSGLSARPYSRRLVRYPLAAPPRHVEDRANRRCNPYERRWHTGEPCGDRGAGLDEPTGPLAQGWKRGLGRCRIPALDQPKNGRRAGRRLQTL